MSDKAYRKYLSSSKWAAKREALFCIRGRYCYACGSEQALIAHHLIDTYGDEDPAKDLIPLCLTCHTYVHSKRKIYSLICSTNIREFTFSTITEIRLARGYNIFHPCWI